MHSGLIFFAYGGTGVYVYAGLDNGALRFEFSNGIYSGLISYDPPDATFCDGQWYDIVMAKDGQKATITVKKVGIGSQGTSTLNVDVRTVSDIYVGGIKPGSSAETFIKQNGLQIETKGRHIHLTIQL